MDIHVKPLPPVAPDFTVTLVLDSAEALALLATIGCAKSAPTDSMVGTNLYSRLYDALQVLPQYRSFGAVGEAVWKTQDAFVAAHGPIRFSDHGAEDATETE